MCDSVKYGEGDAFDLIGITGTLTVPRGEKVIVQVFVSVALMEPGEYVLEPRIVSPSGQVQNRDPIRLTAAARLAAINHRKIALEFVPPEPGLYWFGLECEGVTLSVWPVNVQTDAPKGVH